MLTIKKRGHLAPVFVAAASLLLTACGPPGLRALHKGDRLVQSGHYDSAIEALQTATNLLSKDRTDVLARACNLLGLAYQRSGTNGASARQCYLEALALDRNLAAADYNLGCLEMEQGDLSEARNWLTTYTTLRPRDWDGNMKLGMLNYTLAKKTPETPASSERERQLSFDAAKKAFEKAQSIQPSAEAWNLLAMIDLLRPARPSRETTSNAVAKLKAAVARDPQYAPALLNLAIVYDPVGRYKYGDVTMALKAYRQYLALDPAPLYAKEVAVLVPILDRNSRFAIQLPGHDSEQPAATSLPPGGTGIIIVPKKTNSSPVIRQPPPPPAKTNPLPTASVTLPAPKPEGETLPVRIDTNPVVSPPRNEVLSESGRPVAVPENTAAETNAPLTSTLVRKPTFLSRLFGAKPKPAQTGAESATNAGVTPLPAMERIVHYMPPSVSTVPGNRAEADRCAAEGAAAEKQSRWKDAIGFYEEAVKADPSDYAVCEALGMAAIKSDEFGVALESLHHALVLDPDSANARYDYAWTLQKKNYFSDAAAELEKLLEKHPGEVRAHLLLGTLYAQQLGQPDLARGHYQKVIELNPQNVEAPKIRLWLRNNPET